MNEIRTEVVTMIAIEMAMRIRAACGPHPARAIAVRTLVVAAEAIETARVCEFPGGLKAGGVLPDGVNRNALQSIQHAASSAQAGLLSARGSSMISPIGMVCSKLMSG